MKFCPRYLVLAGSRNTFLQTLTVMRTLKTKWVYITEVCVCVRVCACVLNKYIIQASNLFTFSLRRNWQDMVLVQLSGSPTLAMRMAGSWGVSWQGQGLGPMVEGIVKRYTNALTLVEGQGLGTMVEGIVKRYTNALTSAEGQGLGPMVEGIVKRYTGVSPPEVLYVDRDCCGDTSLRRMFALWSDMDIRLDIWHFMHRFCAGCTTDSHPLYVHVSPLQVHLHVC